MAILSIVSNNKVSNIEMVEKMKEITIIMQERGVLIKDIYNIVFKKVMKRIIIYNEESLHERYCLKFFLIYKIIYTIYVYLRLTYKFKNSMDDFYYGDEKSKPPFQFVSFESGMVQYENRLGHNDIITKRVQNGMVDSKNHIGQDDIIMKRGEN